MTDTAIAIDSVTPKGTTKMLAQFNSTSGAYINVIGVVPLDWLDTEHYDYVEIEIDIKTQKVEGVKDNFRVVDIAVSKTKIYETMVNNQCKEKIYARFHLEVQLDLIRDVVTKLADKAGLLHDELADMNDYIDGVKRANKVLKQAYISNPDFEFVTIEQEMAEHDAKLDGGLHEVMGPKNLLGLGLYNQ
jgi:hypothetical protein